MTPLSSRLPLQHLSVRAPVTTPQSAILSGRQLSSSATDTDCDIDIDTAPPKTGDYRLTRFITSFPTFTRPKLVWIRNTTFQEFTLSHETR